MPKVSDPLLELEKPKKVLSCKVKVITASLDDEKAHALQTALSGDRERFPSAHVARILTSWGHPISHNSILRHRNGECGCV